MVLSLFRQLGILIHFIGVNVSVCHALLKVNWKLMKFLIVTSVGRDTI